MYDLNKSHATQRLGRKIRTGDKLEVEGAVVMAVIEDGVEKAALFSSAPSSTDKVLGFTTLAHAQPSRTSACEKVVVPSAPAALEVGVRNTNLVTSRIRAVRKDNGLVLTIDETFAGSTSNDTVKVDLSKGLFKFHADEAGKEIEITYLYDLTTLQSKQKFGERHINNTGLEADFGETTVLTGSGEIWTDHFDPSQDWSAATAITVGANGLITKGGSKTLSAVVIGVPSESSPLLGLRFALTV
jgi:hypothetical protein